MVSFAENCLHPKPGEAMASRRLTVRSFLASPTTGTVTGLIGLVVPAAGLISNSSQLKDVLLVASALIISAFVARDYTSNGRRVTATRGQPERMADPPFYEKVQKSVLGRRLADIEDLADGMLRVFGADVRYVSVLLFQTLSESSSAAKDIYATDLMYNPEILLTRREYLESNRFLIRSGGSVHRVFICREADLATASFASDFLTLVQEHRSVGVVCGLALIEQIEATHAVDFVVFASAAVLIEEQQGSVDYRSGRSTVQFKRIEGWMERFRDLWESNQTPSATRRLAAYEAIAMPMIDSGGWSAETIRRTLHDSGPVG